MLSVCSPINPFSLRIHDFPDRIFLFEDFDADLAAVENLYKDKSIICEIGSGSGMHLLKLAEFSPESICFGFEIRFKRSVRTIEKAIKSNIENVYILKIKAQEITRIFPHKSIDAIYVNFPDPWPKPKRHKHRVLNKNFLAQCCKLLKPDGFVSVKTDHKEYFSSFIKTVEESKEFQISELSYDLYESEFMNSNIKTEFECLFRSQNLPIYYAQLLPARATTK